MLLFLIISRKSVIVPDVTPLSGQIKDIERGILCPAKQPISRHFLSICNAQWLLSTIEVSGRVILSIDARKFSGMILLVLIVIVSGSDEK